MIHMLEFSLQPRVFRIGQIVRQLLRELRVTPGQVTPRARRLVQRFAHGPIAWQRAILTQHCDAEPGLARHGPLVRRFDPRKNP